MRATSRQTLHLIVTIAVMVIIFVHSAMPGDVSAAESNFFVLLIAKISGWDPQPLSLLVRKSAHFLEYAVLGACLFVNAGDLVLSKGKAVPIKRLCLTAWLIAAAYAVTDEIHQYFVPGRACALLDICIDAAGAAAGVVIAALLRHKKRGKNRE
ncbi:MAG: VanZ family protein [Lachnospiraceae bacterium]|nr:VanZ family protein [Lachnospiraceae bacterium]